MSYEHCYEGTVDPSNLTQTIWRISNLRRTMWALSLLILWDGPAMC
jgi:hypothetical protein